MKNSLLLIIILNIISCSNIKNNMNNNKVTKFNNSNKSKEFKISTKNKALYNCLRNYTLIYLDKLEENKVDQNLIDLILNYTDLKMGYNFVLYVLKADKKNLNYDIDSIIIQNKFQSLPQLCEDCLKPLNGIFKIEESNKFYKGDSLSFNDILKIKKNDINNMINYIDYFENVIQPLLNPNKLILKIISLYPHLLNFITCFNEIEPKFIPSNNNPNLDFEDDIIQIMHNNFCSKIQSRKTKIIFPIINSIKAKYIENEFQLLAQNKKLTKQEENKLNKYANILIKNGYDLDIDIPTLIFPDAFKVLANKNKLNKELYENEFFLPNIKILLQCSLNNRNINKICNLLEENSSRIGQIFKNIEKDKELFNQILKLLVEHNRYICIESLKEKLGSKIFYLIDQNGEIVLDILKKSINKKLIKIYNNEKYKLDLYKNIFIKLYNNNKIIKDPRVTNIMLNKALIENNFEKIREILKKTDCQYTYENYIFIALKHPRLFLNLEEKNINEYSDDRKKLIKYLISMEDDMISLRNIKTNFKSNFLERLINQRIKKLTNFYLTLDNRCLVLNHLIDKKEILKKLTDIDLPCIIIIDKSLNQNCNEIQELYFFDNEKKSLQLAEYILENINCTKELRKLLKYNLKNKTIEQYIIDKIKNINLEHFQRFN
ncbi:MAG: hypothetical protein GY830_07080 [Bacteroidetes bacterium]|nr:hypothetical protein [Bacteroidota bacterium]